MMGHRQSNNVLKLIMPPKEQKEMVQVKVKNKIKKGPGKVAFDIFNACFMVIIMVIALYPVWHVVCGSFSKSSSLVGYRGLLWKPIGFNLSSYELMFENKMLIKSLLNSIFLVVFGTAVNVISTAICAYVLSRKNVFWNGLVSKLIVLTMFFGGGLIPTYLLVAKTLGMADSYLALIIPNAINVYYMIIMRTSFKSIPDDIEEAVKIDGGGHWCMLFKMVIPLSKAIIAVMVLYYGVGHWNAWFEASIYIRDRSLFPLQLVLRDILIANDTSTMTTSVQSMDQEAVGETIKYAIIVFTIIPILAVYPFVQKYFVKGVMIGAVKG